MATAQNVIDVAGNLIRITASPGAAVDATLSAAMLTQLQGMLGVWSEKGLVEIPPPATLATVMDESPGVLDGVALNLAVRYSSAIGKQLDPWLMMEAKDLKSWLGGRKTLAMQLRMQADGMPAVSSGRYNINTDS